eukprot:3734079-Rhodomonas_salina.3
MHKKYLPLLPKPAFSLKLRSKYSHLAVPVFVGHGKAVAFESNRVCCQPCGYVVAAPDSGKNNDCCPELVLGTWTAFADDVGTGDGERWDSDLRDNLRAASRKSGNH